MTEGSRAVDEHIIPKESYKSIYGFTVAQPNQKQTENGVLFSVVEEFFDILNEGIEARREHMKFLLLKIYELHSTNGGKYRTTPNDNNKRFSLDNAYAVGLFCRFCIDNDVAVDLAQENLDVLEKMIHRYWYRVYDVVPVLLLCFNPNRKYKFLYLSLIMLNTVGPCLINKDGDTSGRQLAFVKCMGLGMLHLLAECEDANQEKFLWRKGSSFIDAFRIYYWKISPGIDNPNHPIVKKSKKYFEGKFKDLKTNERRFNHP